MLWLFPALLPALFWVWVIRFTDREHPEPRRWVFACFVGGMIVVGPALAIQGHLLEWAHDTTPASWNPTGFLALTWEILIPVALLEETLKFLAFCLPLLCCRHLDQPLDGIVYGTAAALGFAGLENYLYLFYTSSPAVLLLLVRSVTAVVLHAALTGLLGMAYAQARLGASRPWLRVALWAAVAVFVHTLYDVIALRSMFSTSTAARAANLVIGVIVVGLVYVVTQRIQLGQRLGHRPE